VTRTGVVITVIFALVMSLGAAGFTPQQTPVFKSGVDLVALDVTVVDKDGKPVTGLKASDFTIRINGKAGVVRQLDYVTFGAAPGSEVTVAGREVSNTAPAATAASRGGRVIVLLIDDLSAKPGQGKGLLVAAERMLNTLDLGDMIGLATTSGLGPTLSPSRDRAAALAVLKSKGVVGRNEDLTPGCYIGVHEALEIARGRPRDTLRHVRAREAASASGCDVESAAKRLARDTIHRAAMQLRAYADVINALKPAPAPRVVIALSTGVAPGADDDFDRLDPVSRAAADAGVQFYAMTEVGDMNEMQYQGIFPASLPPQFHPRLARQAESQFLISGVQIVATAAGGEAFKVVGQADRFFKRIMSETSGVYRLGVEAAIPSGATRFLDVKATVKRSGVTVRANRHALLPGASAAPVDVDEALKARIASGGVAFGVPIALATSLRRDPAAADGLQIGVNVELPAGVAAPLVAMYALVNASGQAVRAGKQSLSAPADGGAYQLAFPIAAAPGVYRLRFAVADAAGNIGSVEHALDARLPHLGAASISDLVTTWTDAAGARRFLALETVPPAATSLRAFLELYPDAPVIAPSLVVRFTLTAADGGAVVLERDVTPTLDGSALAAGLELPVTSLSPGTYTLRATILEAGKPTGAVSTSFRKAIADSPIVDLSRLSIADCQSPIQEGCLAGAMSTSMWRHLP
jgi:VWFA-related protein